MIEGPDQDVWCSITKCCDDVWGLPSLPSLQEKLWENDNGLEEDGELLVIEEETRNNTGPNEVWIGVMS